MKYSKIEIPTSNSPYINRMNKISILGLIREYGTISRADLVKKSGLSAPTVTRIVDGLINDYRLVVTLGKGSSSGGRPPVMLSFDGKSNYVIGIDLGATTTRGVLSNLNGSFITEIEFPTQLDKGFETIIEDLANLINKLADSKKSIRKDRIYGVGIAVAGLINLNRQIVEYSPVFDWYNADILKALKPKVSYPIIYDNVTRLMALGGMCYGQGRKLQNFICINVGYGMGSGNIVNGKLVTGADGFAGEFGHITMDSNSNIQCSCKKYGCLEALASGKAIALTAQSRLARGQESILAEMCNNDYKKVTAKMVADAARNGDELALNVFTRAMEYIGIGISNLINIFNPELVVIGGGVSLSGDIFFDNITKVVDKNVMKPTTRKVPILPISFGNNAAIMGAFSLILNKVLNFELRGESDKDLEKIEITSVY